MKFINKQHKDEYNKNKKNMAFIGINKPKSVYQGYSNELKNTDIILGLNSLCLCDIHIAISNSPPRLILSYINNKNEKLLKGWNCCFIFVYFCIFFYKCLLTFIKII